MQSSIRHDATLGWVVAENQASDHYRTNVAGIRSDREYIIKIPSGIKRIAAFGDSYTHGDGVSNEETWGAVLENSRPNLEVLNFGVSGYGIGQSLLRHREAKATYDWDIVLIGFMSKDLHDVVNTYRPFQLSGTGLPFTKPRFIIDPSGELRLIKNPISEPDGYANLLEHPETALKRLGQHDFYYQTRYHSSFFDRSATVRLAKVLLDEYARRVNEYGMVKDGQYNPESEAYQLSYRLLTTFADEVRKEGAQAIILFLPNREDIERAKAESAPSYAPLAQQLTSAGYTVIDTRPAFEGFGPSEVNTGHYTPLGNRLAAEFLVQQLKLR